MVRKVLAQQEYLLIISKLITNDNVSKTNCSVLLFR